MNRSRGLGLHTNEVADPSVHTNVTLLVTTVDTGNADHVTGVTRVSHNCRSVRRHLGRLNTGVAHIDS